MDTTTKLFIMNNAMWALVVGLLILVILYLISQVVRLNSHNITVIDNRQWNTDNSSHTTHQTAYINQLPTDRIGANATQQLTSDY